MDTDTFMAVPAPTPQEPFEPPEFEEREGRLGLSTAFFSLATAFSRVAGLVREIVAASYFGISGPMSAFTIAFQVPNLVRSLFADAAIQAAFVPVFVEKLEQGDRREAFRLASQLIFLVTMVLGAITAIFVLAAPLLVPIFAPGFEGELLDLTVTLAQILFPILILLGISGMVVGILNSDGRFAAFAISPFFWNVAIITVLVLVAPAFSGDDRIYAYAIGVLVGTAIQLAIPTWDLRNTSFNFRMIWQIPRRISPDVRRVLLLMLPVTISLGLINFNLLINSFFGTLVSEQAPAAIDKAFRVYMLPQGIFSVAVATVVFPTLARFAAREEYDHLRSTMANGMRQILLLLVPAAAAILVLSDPMIRLVYQRGEFDAAQTDLVATLSGLRRDPQGVARVDAEKVRDLARDRIWVGARQVDLVQHRDQLEAGLDRRQRRRPVGDPPAAAGWDRAQSVRRQRDPGDDRRRPPRRGQLPGLVLPRRRARPKHDRPDRLPGHGAPRGRRRLLRRDLRPAGARGRADPPIAAPGLVGGPYPWSPQWSASATSRSSPTSTTASRRSRTGSSSSPGPLMHAPTCPRCSTRWISSASAGSRSRRRRFGSRTAPPTARPTTCT